MTVYWMVWDAAAHWIVDRMAAQGLLPAVSRLRQRGVRAAARPPAPNCQTPPSLATLFTGTWPAEHGVTGFRIPSPDGPVTADTPAFAPGACRAPAVWQLAGDHGLRTVSVHAPWIFDAHGGVAGTVDAAVEAYSGRLARAGWCPVPGTITLGPHTLSVTAVPGDRARADIAVTGDAGTGARVTLHADDGWRQFRLPGGGTWLRLATAGGQPVLLHTGAWRQRMAGADAGLLRALADLPVFAGEGIGGLYRSGVLGPRLADGGDGSAEELFLSSVECAGRGFAAALTAVLREHQADLVVSYLPATDDAGHEFAGWCDELSGAFRPAIADRIWAWLARCYRAADALLGQVLERAAPEDTVLLTADHGITGTAWQVFPNAALAAAGLAAAHDGVLDPGGSAVLYHPANNGALAVNHDGRPGGVVPAAEAPALLSRACQVLGEWTLPGTGRPVVRHAAPDGRLVFDQDCQPAAGVPADGTWIRPAAKPGAHVTNSGDPRLHAVFAACGPGLTAGRDLGVVDNTLPARIALLALGLRPPAPDDESASPPCSAT